jgi:hypothetical protein
MKTFLRTAFRDALQANRSEGKKESDAVVNSANRLRV